MSAVKCFLCEASLFTLGKKGWVNHFFLTPSFIVGVVSKRRLQKQLALNFMVSGVKIANFGASRFTQAFAKSLGHDPSESI